MRRVIGQPVILYQNAGVASLGQRANSIVRGSQNMDLPLPQFLLHVKTQLGDHVYQKWLNFCAELHILGVIAGVIDGPTDQYRAAIKQALGSYFSNLLKRSQRTSAWENLGPLDAVANLGGYYYKLWGGAASLVGADHAAELWNSTGDKLLTTDPDKVLFNLGSDFFSSIWNSCKTRWDQFWTDFKKEGLLVAAGKLQIDLSIMAGELAITVAAAAVTGGVAGVALAGVKIVGRRISASATEIVVRALTRASHAVPDSAKILGPINLPDANIDGRILREVLDEDKLGVGSPRSDVAKRAEQPNEPVNKPEGGANQNSRQKSDVRQDGSYRDAADPAGVRRSATGEAMVQDPKTNSWVPVSGASSDLKGKFGETMADRYMESQGYTKVNGPMSQMSDKGHNGIDGVYRHNGPPPRYVISDAKYGTAGLGTLVDGRRQMSPSWIMDRLPTAVDRRTMLEIDDLGYSSSILKVDQNGKVTEKSLADINWRDNEK